MYDKVMKEKELLYQLNNELEEIKIFLIGNIPTENSETGKEENCLEDTMIDNLKSIDKAITITSIIKDTIKGGAK